MQPNEMSNEALIFSYFYGGCDKACDHVELAVEIQTRLRAMDGMIPKPKLDVTVFEGGAHVLTMDGSFILGASHDRLIYQYAERIGNVLGIPKAEQPQPGKPPIPIPTNRRNRDDHVPSE